MNPVAVLDWILGIIVALIVLFSLMAMAVAQPPVKEGDVGFFYGDVCNEVGHAKMVEVLLRDYKQNEQRQAKVWASVIEAEDCMTLFPAIPVFVLAVYPEGMTLRGKVWTTKFQVKGGMVLFALWFANGSQPEHIDFQERSA